MANAEVQESIYARGAMAPASGARPGTGDTARNAEPAADGGFYDFEWLVIGPGFGGSVSALGLAAKGYRVGVLEAGRRFRGEDLMSFRLLPSRKGRERLAANGGRGLAGCPPVDASWVLSPHARFGSLQRDAGPAAIGREIRTPNAASSNGVRQPAESTRTV